MGQVIVLEPSMDQVTIPEPSMDQVTESRVTAD